LRGLSKIDLPARLAPVLPVWAGELITALMCLATAGVLRILLDAAIPGAAPFVLLFPAALVATLVGGWRPGLVTLTVSELVAWSYLIPPRGFSWKGEATPANLAAIFFAGAIVVGVAQLFRTGSRQDAADTRTKLAERDLMLRELEHRTKNNLQTVAALIGVQLRRAADEPARQALRQALSRIDSISEAQRNLYVVGDATRSVDMAAYLQGLCGNLAEALFLGELVRLDCRADAGELDRDRAVAIGLIVNELVTNAAKHAFADGGAGQINVVFERERRGYRLIVEDNGRGLPADFATRGLGLGRGLVEAFTRQVGGSLIVGDGPGARFEVELAA
jgi:two-component sensor histidine kinase